MSNATQRNFAAAQGERQRRINAGLEGEMPIGSLGVTGDPAWDAFFGSLHDKQQQASLAGMGFRADLGGIGRDGGEDPGLTGGLNPLERQSLKNIALMRQGDADVARAKGEVAAQNAFVNAQSDKNVSDLYAADEARKVNEAFALREPGSITTETGARSAAPVSQQTAFGVARPTVTAGQSFSVTPTRQETDRERMLAMLPGPMRTNLEAQFAAQDLANRKVDLAEQTAKATADASAAAVLSPDAIEENARLYLKTGTMPTLGMKDPGNRAKILNRAAELAGGGGGDVAANKADYKADAASLVKLQGQRDAVGAFEDTALKNLDQFLELAKKVPDTGSPALNRPLRAIDEQALGSADLAAYNAARRTVIPEFAKILSNPTLSGQLSDSARKEVEDVISGGATLAQTLSIANTLKTDAANRRTSYDDQLAKVRERIQKGGAKSNASNAAPDAANLRKKYNY